MNQVLNIDTSLNGMPALILFLSAVILSSLFTSSKQRLHLFLALNILVICFFESTVLGIITLLTVLIAFHAFVHTLSIRRITLSAALSLAGISILWLFLFAARDSSLFHPINPFKYIPIATIGLSYITFRCISYLQEIQFVSDKSLTLFLTYALFFPSLIAGPIERLTAFSKKIKSPVYDQSAILPSLNRIANGLLKKYVLADNLSVFGIFAYSEPTQISTPLLWIGSIAQLFLIYLDFSGYCDIVIGASRLMGFSLSENFNKPFASTNIQEFWTRWHITLSTIVKDYIFSPLNILLLRHVDRRVHGILIPATFILSMVLIALWHGTSWGFLVFGVLQGLALVLFQTFKSKKDLSKILSLPQLKPFNQALVYSFVSISLIFWMTKPHEWITIIKHFLGDWS